MITATQIAYTAGLFDGEGSITIQAATRKYSPNPYYRVRVDLAMTHKETIEWLHKTYGGHFGAKIRGPYINGGDKRYKPLWRWAIECRSAESFIRTIRPYLVTKAKQADIAITFSQQRKANRWNPLTNEEIRERHELALSMKKLNKRGA